MTVRRILLLALVACLSITSPAHAYLDPGTGSMLLSAIIGVTAAVGLALKLFWYRLVGLLRGKKGARPDAQ
jgi:NADH:ubiquinone oxidoreductase subunit K